MPDLRCNKRFRRNVHPDYAIDVLRIMVTIAKTKPFSLIWPGKFEEGKLVYAEEGFQDYKVFDVNKYEITCII